MLNLKTKIGAVLISASLVGGAGTYGLPVYAQTTPGAVVNEKAVDADHEVSLTINKFEGDPVTNGDTSGLTKLEGIEFRVVPLTGIDLTTNEGWDKVAKLSEKINNGGIPDTNERDAPIVKSTNSEGVAKFDQNDGLKVGAYYVTEEPKDGFTTVKPFIVTLPFQGENGWEYNQVVNPKNQNVKPTKEVDDSQAGIGKNLTYTINVPIPAGDMDRLVVVDEMYNDGAGKYFLSFDKNTLKVTAPGVIFENGDYELKTLEGVTGDADETHGFTLEFTKAGLDRLKAARVGKPGLNVSVKFDATIIALPTDDEGITNTATVGYPNGVEINTDVVPTDDPDNPKKTQTTFANLELIKTGVDAEEGQLAGAEFDVFRCENEGTNENPEWKATSDPVTFAEGDENTAKTKITTTDANGQEATKSDTYTAKGLVRSSFGANTDKTYDYCVLETKAPEGFIANPEIVPATWVEGTGDQLGTFKFEVENKKDTWSNRLPATGAWGILLIFLVGLALLARGLYTSYRDRGATA